MQELRHHYLASSNGGHHRFSATGASMPNSVKPWSVPPNHVAIRMLCHVSRVGGLIGKAGSIIRHLHHLTSAKIRVEPLHLTNSTFSSPSEVQRVILIIGSTSVSRKLTLHASNNIIEEFEVSAVQEAVVRVFERVIEVAAAGGELEEEGEVEVDGIVSCRLLVERGQVGSLIGKGGKTIEMLKKETGCRIKVLTKERLPACAMTNDEMVEV